MPHGLLFQITGLFFLNIHEVRSTYYLPCEQWFLLGGRYATKGEKPLRASVCFFDRAAVQRHGRIYYL